MDLGLRQFASLQIVGSPSLVLVPRILKACRQEDEPLGPSFHCVPTAFGNGQRRELARYQNRIREHCLLATLGLHGVRRDVDDIFDFVNHSDIGLGRQIIVNDDVLASVVGPVVLLVVLPVDGDWELVLGSQPHHLVEDGLGEGRLSCSGNAT